MICTPGRSRSFASLLTALCLGMTVLFSGNLFAQGFPNKPLRIVAPFPAGSSTDILARLIAQKMSEGLGQPVLVDNRPGANGIIGTELVARAAPDGYTMVLASNGTHGINNSLFSKLPYDPIKDFAPVMLVGTVPYVLLVNNNFPGQSVKDLVAQAKAKPGGLAMGHSASVSQLTGELFRLTTGIEVTSVAYKGTPPALTDLMGGQIQFLFDPSISALPQVRGGKLRALAVTSPKRTPLLPDVPTVAESGYPGFDAAAFTGFLVPAGTPREVVNRLHAEFVRIFQLPDVQEKMTQSGLDVVASTPEQFAEAIRREIDKWARVFRDAKLPKMN